MDFWKKILKKLQDKQNVYLLTVVENIGSSPGRQGFKMFVSEDGTIFGSIGGGIMEYQFVELAKKQLNCNRLEILFKRQVHNGSVNKNSSGMICSGEQTVVFHPLESKDIITIQHIIFILENSKKSILELTGNGLLVKEEELEQQFTFTNKNNWQFKEQIAYKEVLYIVGGGHVGLATSQIMHFLNFHVIVLDNRTNLNTLETNNFAHKKLIIEYTEIEKYIKPNSFVVIMTSKYTEDKLIVSQLINNDYKFLGVLGSKSKMKTMFVSLKKEGVSSEKLETIYTPIGISIKSQTPEEIAISIAAQVIKVKNSLK